MKSKLLFIVVMFIFLSSFSYAALTDGLTSYYSFDINASPNIGDVTGTENGGVTHISSCILSGCYQYDGSTGYLLFNGLTDLENKSQWALSFWFNSNETPFTGNRNIVATGGGSSNEFLISAEVTFSHITTRIDTTAGVDKTVTTSNTLNSDTWTLLTYSYDGSTLSLYVDGDLNGTLAYSGSNLDYTDNLYFGSSSGAVASQYWNGSLDELGFWNRNLSSAEISELYNNGAGYNPLGTASSNFTITGNVNEFSSYLYTGDFLRAYESTSNGIINFINSTPDKLPNIGGSGDISGISMSGNALLYHFDSQSGIGNDSSGQGNSFSASNDYYLPTSDVDGHYKVNATSSIVVSGAPSELNPSEVIVSLWINPDSWSGSSYNILSKGGTLTYGSTVYSYRIYKSGSSILGRVDPFYFLFSYTFDPLIVNLGSTTNIPATEWTHLAIEYDSSTKTLKGYRNGVQVDADATGGNFQYLPNTASDNLGFGTVTTGDSLKLNEIAIFGVAKGDTFIEQLYNETDYSAAFNFSSYVNATISPNNFQLYDVVYDYNVSNNLIYNFSDVTIDAVNVLTSTNIQNFSINITYDDQSFQNYTSTTTGNINYHLIGDYIYNITIDANNYVINSSLINISKGTSNLTFYLYETNSINITFKDEENKNIIDFENISLEIISDSFSGNYSTTNGTLFLSFITPENYIMRFSSASYDENFYYFELSNRTTNSLTLYMTNASKSTQVTATVYDEASNLLENAYIKVQRYNVVTNSYDQTQIVSTNFEGEAVLNIILDDEYYKFIIEYPIGTVRKTTSPTYVHSNTIEFQIQLGETVGESFFNTYGISSNLTFNDATNNFRWLYIDGSNLVTQGCLQVYKVTALVDTLYNSSCASSPSSTILVGVLNESGTTYRANTYVYFDSNPTFIESLYKSFATTANTGSMGLLATVILVIAFSFLGIVSPISALILAPLPIVFSSVLGLIEISVSTSLAIYVVALIVAFIVRK